MKQIIVVCVITFNLFGCTCDRFYVPTNNKGNDALSFKDSIISLSCWVPPSSKKDMFITLEFISIDSMNVEYISMEISSKGFLIPLLKVKMYDYKDRNFNPEVFEETSFDKLPYYLRVTSVRGLPVPYYFNFEGKKKINSDKLNLNVSVVLKSQKEIVKIKRCYSLIRDKHCSFRVH